MDEKRTFEFDSNFRHINKFKYIRFHLMHVLCKKKNVIIILDMSDSLILPS